MTLSTATHSVSNRNHPTDSPPDTPRDRLIVALDQDSSANKALVKRLGPAVTFYKVGWISLLNRGVEIVPYLLGEGKQVFLDLKIFDVPNTVGESVAAVASLGVRFVTVHGNREVIREAVRGRGERRLEILAVTVLTSLTELDARRMYRLPDAVTLEDHVVEVARSLVEFGCDGVIASPQEIGRIRQAVPQRVVIAAPAIRLPGEPAHDQKRTGTPYESIVAGADFLIVGRSIYQDADPRSKVEKYVELIDKGLRDRSRKGEGL